MMRGGLCQIRCHTTTRRRNPRRARIVRADWRHSLILARSSGDCTMMQFIRIGGELRDGGSNCTAARQPWIFVGSPPPRMSSADSPTPGPPNCCCCCLIPPSSRRRPEGRPKCLATCRSSLLMPQACPGRSCPAPGVERQDTCCVQV